MRRGGGVSLRVGHDLGGDVERLFDRLVGETRGRLLVLLRRGRKSIADLGVALGVTDNAVRTHIAALERDGLVEPAGVQRDTGGKPARLYGLTDQAEELFPKAYAVVLSALLREIELQDGRDRVLALLRVVGEKAAAAHATVAEGLEARVEAAATVLRGLGGDVEVERAGEGWRLCGYGCPLSAVAAEHAEVCALAEALVAEITGRPVREECDRSGRPRCAFRIEGGRLRARATGAEDR